MNETPEQAAVRKALKERDFEWREAVALADSVEPTPGAVKHWLAVSQEYFIAEAVRVERERVTEHVKRIRDTGPTSDQRAADYQVGYNDALDDVLAFISGQIAAVIRGG